MCYLRCEQKDLDVETVSSAVKDRLLLQMTGELIVMRLMSLPGHRWAAR